MSLFSNVSCNTSLPQEIIQDIASYELFPAETKNSGSFRLQRVCKHWYNAIQKMPSIKLLKSFLDKKEIKYLKEGRKVTYKLSEVVLDHITATEAPKINPPINLGPFSPAMQQLLNRAQQCLDEEVEASSTYEINFDYQTYDPDSNQFQSHEMKEKLFVVQTKKQKMKGLLKSSIKVSDFPIPKNIDFIVKLHLLEKGTVKSKVKKHQKVAYVQAFNVFFLNSNLSKDVIATVKFGVKILNKILMNNTHKEVSKSLYKIKIG